MPYIVRAGLVTVTWLGVLLRFRALFANRFHADEALFASWARHIAVWRDPLLLTQPVDKPPLLFYLQALFYPLMGPEEWAARLPSLVASILTIPLVGVLAWRLYRRGAAVLLAAMFVAVAPVAIQFSATAFTDPLLTFWLTAALYVALAPAFASTGSDRSVLLSGLLFGLAISTKHQAWLFLPLFVAAAWHGRWSRRAVFHWLAGAAAVLLLLGLWSVARGQTTGLWLDQLANAGGLRLAWSWEVTPRLLSLVALLRLSLGWPLLLMTGLALGPVVWSAVVGGSRQRGIDAILLSYTLGYLAFHWLTAVPIWDRYLLPILPLLAILTARGLVVGCDWLAGWLAGRVPEHAWTRAAPAVALLGLVLLAGWAALPARSGQLPLGGQPMADQGAAQTAALLAEAPYGTVLYDHFYSWHWRYQLFDAKVYVNWFADAAVLVDDLNVFAESAGERYLVLPANQTAAPIVRTVIAAGYGLEEVAPEGSVVRGMRLYRILPNDGAES